MDQAELSPEFPRPDDDRRAFPPFPCLLQGRRRPYGGVPVQVAAVFRRSDCTGVAAPERFQADLAARARVPPGPGPCPGGGSAWLKGRSPVFRCFRVRSWDGFLRCGRDRFRRAPETGVKETFPGGGTGGRFLPGTRGRVRPVVPGTRPETSGYPGFIVGLFFFAVLLTSSRVRRTVSRSVSESKSVSSNGSLLRRWG